MWIFIVYILNTVYTGACIRITSDQCGLAYDMDIHDNLVVSYSGIYDLRENPCSVEFTKDTHKKVLCISAENINLDCDTSLEYHEAFVKNYINPEVDMSCTSINMEEWCPSEYQDNVFIVIRKSSSNPTSDDIKLRVYLKDVPEEEEANSTLSMTLMIVLIPIAVVFVCICVGVIIQLKCDKARASRSQIAYHTTSGTVDIPAGQVPASTYPASAYTQPSPQPYPPLQQGNYHVYPMQTAYPAAQGAAPGNQAVYSQQGNQGQNTAQYYSSGQPVDMNAPPPSYDSLNVQKR